MAEEMTGPDLLDYLKAHKYAPNPDRKAGGYYSRDGDCWFLILEDVPYKRVRVDNVFTAFEALDDGRLVGLQFKAITKLLKEATALTCFIDEQQGVQVVGLLMETWKLEAGATPGVSPAFRSRMYAKAIRAVTDDVRLPKPELAIA